MMQKGHNFYTKFILKTSYEEILAFLGISWLEKTYTEDQFGENPIEKIPIHSKVTLTYS